MQRLLRANRTALPQGNANGGGLVIPAGNDPAFHRTYFEHLTGGQPSAKDAWAIRPGSPVTGRTAVPDAEHRRTGFHADRAGSGSFEFLPRARIEGTEGGVAGSAAKRPARGDAFGPADIALPWRPLPIIRRGLRVHRHFAEADALDGALFEALDRVRRGVFVVGAEGELLLANTLARALLAEPGAALRCERGAIAATHAGDAAALRRAIALAASGSSAGPCVVRRPCGKLPVVIEALPVGGRARFDGLSPDTRALLLATDPAREEEPSAALIKAVFGATATEAAVAVRIARGEDVPTVAAALGVSTATVRTHLNRMFEKTGTRRQAQLAWLLGRLPTP
ncbi:MAG: helix-turn-helix transcriptional regulator [Acetobacteraceae bacterium]|nr:helix-turn-helix transcriptional regulator [Acetobacteraceae bacterium]